MRALRTRSGRKNKYQVETYALSFRVQWNRSYALATIISLSSSRLAEELASTKAHCLMRTGRQDFRAGAGMPDKTRSTARGSLPLH
jgi:hypothetical protein